MCTLVLVFLPGHSHFWWQLQQHPGKAQATTPATKHPTQPNSAVGNFDPTVGAAGASGQTQFSFLLPALPLAGLVAS